MNFSAKALFALYRLKTHLDQDAYFFILLCLASKAYRLKDLYALVASLNTRPVFIIGLKPLLNTHAIHPTPETKKSITEIAIDFWLKGVPDVKSS